MFKKILKAFIPSFLFLFMWVTFGPSEIFFSNVSEFDFVFKEFGFYMIAATIIGAIVLAVLLALIPEKISKVLKALLLGLSVAGYIQVMFLNSNLDLLGLNPDGYSAETSKIVVNTIIWVVIVAIVMFLSVFLEGLLKHNSAGTNNITDRKSQKGNETPKFEGTGEKIILYGSGILLAIQLVAFVSLFFAAPSKAYAYDSEDTFRLSGKDQFKVSEDGNVVVIILDSFSNESFEKALSYAPDSADFLHDFTYFNNVCPNYLGTFPSLVHMLTGNDVDFGATVNEWTAASWKSEKADSFYNDLAANGYDFRLYTPDLNIICGLNDFAELTADKISNVTNSPYNMIVANKKLCVSMLKMSGYRMFPEILKPLFYTGMDEYEDVITIDSEPVYHENYEFFSKLSTEGLQSESGRKLFLVQHLMGTHLFKNDAQCNFAEDSSFEETATGCLKLVSDYLDDMKELGVYDNSVIIITADHGMGEGQHSSFFIKNVNEVSDSMKVNDAPVTFCEFLPTIAALTGLDSSKYGETFFDIEAGSVRERTLYIRGMSGEFPAVPCYTGDKDGSSNVWFEYTYEGGEERLLDLLHNDTPTGVIPMVDSYF